MKNRSKSKTGAPRRRMTKRQCMAAWAAALGLVLLPAWSASAATTYTYYYAADYYDTDSTQTYGNAIYDNDGKTIIGYEITVTDTSIGNSSTNPSTTIYVCGGYVDSSGNVYGTMSYNSVTVKDNTNNSLYGVYGAYSAYNDSNYANFLYNTVVLDNATVTGYLYAARASGYKGSTLTGNSLTIQNGSTVSGTSYAAYTNKASGTLTGNSITITDSNVSGKVYVAYTNQSSPTMTGNTLTVTGSSIIGKYSSSGTSATTVYAAYHDYSTAGAGTFEGNVVKVEGTSTTDDDGTVTASVPYVVGKVYGAYSASGGGSTDGDDAKSFTENGVDIDGGVLLYPTASTDTYIVGAYGAGTTTYSGNYVTIDGTTDTTASNYVHIYNIANIAGSYASASYATSSGNYVTISGGDIEATNIYAAYAYRGSTMSGNYVSISDDDYKLTVAKNNDGSWTYTYNYDTYVTSDIYGAYSGGAYQSASSTNNNSAAVSGNYITVSGGYLTGDLYGGYVNSYGTASNNKITVKGGHLKGNLYGGYGYLVPYSSSPSYIKNYAMLNDAVTVSDNKVTVTGRLTVDDLTYTKISGSSSSIKMGYSTVSIDGSIYGGYEESTYYSTSYTSYIAGGSVKKNHVELTTIALGTTYDTLSTGVYGGYFTSYGTNSSYRGSVDNNSVALISSYWGNPDRYDVYSDDGTTATMGQIYGGYAETTSGAYVADVTNNWVEINGGYMWGGTCVYGGYSYVYNDAEPTDVTATVSENSVIVTTFERLSSGGFFWYGGYANSNTLVTDNGVSITGSGAKSGNSYGTVYAGYSAGSGDVTENEALISKAYVSAVFGGSATSGDADSNTVTISDSYAQSIVYGGYSSTGGADGNKVTITDSTLSSVLYGGYSAATSADSETGAGYANDNTVTITGSTVNSVRGGYGVYANDNTVILEDTTVTAGVWGGYTASGGYGTGNSVYLKGDVSVAQGIVGGTGNSLYVSGTGNSAGSIYTFGTYTFDVTGVSDGDVMLAVSERYSSSSESLTESDQIKVTGTLSIGKGDTIWLMMYTDASTWAYVLSSALEDVEIEGNEYELGSDSDGSGASLEGEYDAGLKVVTYETSTDDDGNVSYGIASVADLTDNSSTSATGDAIVLTMSDTVTVESVDFALSSSTDDGSTVSADDYEWGTALLTLESDEKYSFSSDTELTGVGESSSSDDETDDETTTTLTITVTGDAVASTLIADNATSTLLDGSDAESVTGLDDVDLGGADDENSITLVYAPVSGVTVGNGAHIETASLSTASTEDDSAYDSIVLVNDGVSYITFGSIEYSDSALITLDEEGTYDLSGTDIDVSGLTVVDEDGGSISGNFDGDSLIMTLIDANGVDASLEENSIASGADISEEQTFGYLLEGSDYDSDAGTGSSLSGTLTGVVTVEAASTSDSTSDDDTTSSYNLVLKTGTYVTVSEVDFALSDDSDGTATVALGSDTLLTLNSSLTYDFNDAALATASSGDTDTESDTDADSETDTDSETDSSTDSSDGADITVTGVESTLLAQDTAIVTLLDTNGAAIAAATDDGEETDDSSLAVLTSQISAAYDNGTYTYNPADGVTVTGSVSVSTSTETDEDASAESTTVALTVSDIDSITFEEIIYSTDAVLTLDEDGTYDLSGTDIDVSNLTVVDEGGGAISENFDGDELVMTLIDANGVSTGLESNESVYGGADISEEQTFGYLLQGSDYDSDAGTGSSLSGTLQGVVIAEAASTSDSTADSTSDDDATSSYNLVLRTGTTVTVTGATLDMTSLDADADALITLSALTYDFTSLSSDDVSFTTDDDGNATISADTLLDSGTSFALIDASNATVTDDTLGALEGLEVGYSYSLADGAAVVTGTGTTSYSSSVLSYTVSNISALDFYIDDDMDGTTILTVESAVDLSGTAITAYATTELYAGYSVTLLYSEGGITTDGATTYTGTAYEGVSLEYDLTVELSDDNTIVAYIAEDEESSSGKQLREETKSLAETRVAQSAAVDQGADLLVTAFDNAVKTSDGVTTWVPYVAFSASDMSYNTGSHVDLDGFNATVGLIRNTYSDDGVFSWGPLFQYGKADYDSYVGSVTASGDTEYVGGGLFARKRWNNGVYAEAALTAGYSDADYSSVTILEGVQETFSVGSKYWAAYLGVAKDIPLTHSRVFTPYLRYLYSKVDSAGSYLSSGEYYDFGDVDSSRLRAGFRITWDMSSLGGKNSGFHTYFGAAYQYQFDGSAVGTYNGLRTPEPSNEGGSGMFEGGLYFRPLDSDMVINLGVTGWTGEQEGLEGMLKFEWNL